MIKTDNSPQAAAKRVIADRAGGAVRYPNGQRVIYEPSENELPEAGKDYVFFLSRDDTSPNYKILVAYEVENNRLRQLDTGQSFDVFKNASKEDFLAAIRSKVANVNK
jgi:hypothetical protein